MRASLGLACQTQALPKTLEAKTVPSTGNKRDNTNASSEVLAIVPFVIGDAESGNRGPLASIGLNFPVI